MGNNMTTDSNDDDETLNNTDPPPWDREPPSTTDAQLDHILRSYFRTISPTRNQTRAVWINPSVLAMDRDNRNNLFDDINQHIESISADIASFVNHPSSIPYSQILDRIHHLDNLIMLSGTSFVSAGGGSHEEAIPRKSLIKTRRSCGDKDHDHDKVCVVCLDQLFQENGTIVILRCGHEYHDDCITKWLRIKNICPLCRVGVDGIDIENEEEDS